MSQHHPAMAAYFNAARHNLFEVLNQIARKAGLSMAENDELVGSHPVLQRLKLWADEEAQDGGRISDKDIRVVKLVVRSLQIALPILGDSFAEAITGQKASIDFKRPEHGKGGHSETAPKPAAPPEKTQRTMRVSDVHWVLAQLIERLMALRNFYSHAHQQAVTLDGKTGVAFSQLLGVWFDAGRREAKSRFEYLEQEVVHLMRIDAHTKREDPQAPHALTMFSGRDRLFTEKGAAYFCCLFLDKQQGNEFLKQLRGFKHDASRASQATLRTYTHWSIRLPHVRIETDSTHQSLALDMFNELARCPAEIYENLSAEDQKPFDITPETDEEWLQNGESSAEGLGSEEGDGLNVRFIRHGDRFAPLLMDYFDHIATAMPAHDPGIRFALDLGDFYFAAYPKKLTDGSEDVRRLKQKVIRFGLLSEARQAADAKPAEWKNLERVNTEREYPNPYIVQTTPHYHLNPDGGSIPIQLKPDQSAPLYAAPQIDPTRPQRFEPLPAERPDFWLSPYELVNLGFYHHLRTRHNLPAGQYPQVNHLLQSHKSNLLRLYKHMQAHPAHWHCPSSEALAQKLQDFCADPSARSFYTLRPKDLSDDLRNLLLGKGKVPAEQMLQQARNTLNLLWEDGEARLRDVQRVKQALRERIKPGKGAHRVLRAGEMATFLAKDLLRFQPEQDPASAHKGKPTSIMADLLQARLAYFGRDKTSLPALFVSLGLSGHEAAEKNHPFLGQINLADAGMRGIAQFYEAYLQARQQHLQGLKQTLSLNATGALQTPALAWLHLAQMPQRLQGKDSLQSLLARYLQPERTNEPLNLPRGLFRELVLKALMGLNIPALTSDLQEALAKEAERGMPTSISYLIDLYFVHVQKDCYQDFYCLDLPKLQDRIDEAISQGWRETRWAEATADQLRKENRGITKQALHQRLDALWKERAAHLQRNAQEKAKQMRQRATQDQVLFLAARQLIDLDTTQRRAAAAQPETEAANMFDTLRLQTLSRSDLNNMVAHELRVAGKTIYVEQIKAKNIGQFKRLGRDRRLSGILHYYDAERIHLSAVAHELQAYPRAQNAAFERVLQFEQRENKQKKLQANALPKGQSLHRTLVEQRLQQSKLPHAEQDRLKADALTLRNAFCHNQTPAPENLKDPAAAPTLQAAREQLAPARQQAGDISRIKGGQTVAQHFAQTLQERYDQLQNAGKTPSRSIP